MITDDSTAAPRLTAKGRATRARIVAAAAELIYERGVAGTGIDEVRRVAAVSGSQMSHYFGDKTSLVRAVIAYQADAITASPLDRPDRFDGFDRPDRPDRFDSFAGLRAWTDAIVARNQRAHCAGGCPFGSLAAELAETGEATRQDLADGFQRWHDRIRDGLSAMRERGELRADADPEALAFALLSAQQGGVLLAQTLRDPAPLRAALDGALAYIESFATR